MRLHTVKLEIMQYMSEEFKKLRKYISTVFPASGSITTAPAANVDPEARESDVQGGNADPDPFCTEPQDRGGHHPSPDDHNEEMGINIQEGNASVGSGDGDDEEVPHDGVGNVEQNPTAYASNMVEEDGGASEMMVEAITVVLKDKPPITKMWRSIRLQHYASSIRTSYARGLQRERKNK
ncbi:Hypothetical predicted protein [Olea europaea subsp. europaea]|uniref:Uncharacterized protein n=1 Tax=Olea europaea subsp. europaea TaxID=158383 RepID=A0A8S0UH40_OLEEU|nr:Hypothetical predicted protein [Olea europaea subsp. europaea]